MATTYYAQNLALLKDAMPDMEETPTMEGEDLIYSVYLGSFMFLDPCGRYHHCISPNGLTNRCINYWESLDKAADRLSGWIESGEGDPTDIYFCKLIS